MEDDQLDDNKIVYESIGEVKNNFSKPDDPQKIRNSQSQLILKEKYLPALEGLERYKYLLVVYHIDRSPGYRERVHPMGDPEQTRARCTRYSQSLSA